MFTSTQYRAKAIEYGELVKTSAGPGERREFQKLEESFALLADNAQWLEENHHKTVHRPESEAGGEALTAAEEHVLRCLGGALIMQWNTLPIKLQRELFDKAGSMGELLQTVEFRLQIARVRYTHKNDEDPAST